MGKHLQREHSNPQFEGNHPGCMWGILHILDYHYWHNVKKLLPRRRNSRGRHARCSESRKLSLNSHDPGAVEAVMNDEADYFFVDQSTKTSPTNKSSGKARIKALIAKEMSKEENHKCQVLGTPAQSQFQRTDSIHHLEPSDHRLPEIKTDWRHPIIFLHSIPNTSATKPQDPSLLKAPEKLVPCNNKCDIYGTMNAVGYLGQNQVAEKHKLHPEHIDKERETSLNQKLKDANQLDRDASHPQFEDYVDDVLEIFKVNKELFLKMLQDPDVGNANRFHILPKKVRLNKSGSFPVADVTRGRNFRPTKLEHKQNEVWSFPKGEKFLAGTQASRLVVSMSSKDLSAKSMPLMDDDSAGSVLKQEKSFSSLDLPSGFNDQESNQASIYCFEDSKQKINHAIKENKEESNHTPLDAFLHRFPHGCRISTDGKEIAKRWKESTQGADGSDGPKIGYEIDGSVYDLGKGSRIHRVRRASSLNESLDRYSQLLEFSFRNEAKLHLSKSLKLTKEGEVSSAGHGPNSFRRILSVTDLESYFPLQNEGLPGCFLFKNAS
ncbi:hypothetical protein L1049_013967 [Liquidambar formosana]|uniref:DUF3741 domain-containing protein n=1 Tax=Liquidambar formosana TaxID=63359 RepID=A0AAP0RPY7_LIQFO